MSSPNFYAKVYRADLEATMKAKGYAYFTKGDYNLNIIGVRRKGVSVTNKYDDILVLIYHNGNGWQRFHYDITTEPGDYYVRKHIINPKGTAILVPGQYRGCWELGKHNGKYEALVQTKPVKVYRDNNRDGVYDLDPTTIDEGLFGINIHRSNEYYTRSTIDMYSAGCQVFAKPGDFNKFIAICKKQKERYGNSFTYTLIDEADLLH